LLSELGNYKERIQDLRDQVIKLIAGLPQEALDWRPLPAMEPGTGAEEGESTTNSLAVLAAHIAGAEHFWIGEVVGGLPQSRDRAAEFVVQNLDAAELVAKLEQAAGETRKVLSGLQPAGLGETREVEGHTFPIRWCILHVIDHTALHLGHMQLTYQLWMGGQGVRSPFWHERLRTGS
jgi:uncharacterized damage-inducible protein DinB